MAGNEAGHLNTANGDFLKHYSIKEVLNATQIVDVSKPEHRFVASYADKAIACEVVRVLKLETRRQQERTRANAV